MKAITAMLSMLHEPAGRATSATRLFRGEPVLAWTLHRLGQSRHINQTAIVCWEDQLAHVQPIADELDAFISVHSPRAQIPQIEAVAASRRWADGWRGGLLGTCEFDRGFYGPWALELLQKLGGESLLLVDPSAGLIDPVLVDQLIDHSQNASDLDMCFSQAAPGLAGVLLRRTLLEQLAAAKTHPGSLLNYRPDLPRRDPIAGDSCMPVPAPLARTLHRFTLDSERQIDRISSATVHLNGQLISTEAEHLLHSIDSAPFSASLPRELVLELTTRRATRPIFQPQTHLDLHRPDLSLEQAKTVFQEFAAADDARLTLAGAGDPMLHPQAMEIVDLAHQAGIAAIALETDLVGLDAATIARLAESPVDIISVHIPAVSRQMYQSIMGIDALNAVLGNLSILLERRQILNRGTPLIVPTFVKCAANLAEMEAWYDHWLKILGCAVISGPTDLAGQIPSVAAVQMAPPRRRPCARIASRMTILSDGRIVACEQDARGQNSLAEIGQQSLADAWAKVTTLRHAHEAGQWNVNPLCANCKDWHRP